MPDGNPYHLSISVLCDATEGGFALKTESEEVAKALVNLFHGVQGIPANSAEIALERCQAVADTSITLDDLRIVDQWRLEWDEVLHLTQGGEIYDRKQVV